MKLVVAVAAISTFVLAEHAALAQSLTTIQILQSGDAISAAASYTNLNQRVTKGSATTVQLTSNDSPSYSPYNFNSTLFIEILLLMDINSNNYQLGNPFSALYNSGLSTASQGVTTMNNYVQPLQTGSYNAYATSAFINSYDPSTDPTNLYNDTLDYQATYENFGIEDPDSGGDDESSFRAPSTRAASSNVATLPDGILVYPVVQQFQNGSQTTFYYAEAAHVNLVGWYAINAPLWSGSEGTYPELIEVAYSLPITGRTVAAYSGIVIADSQASQVEIATTYKDTLGNIAVVQDQYTPSEVNETVDSQYADGEQIQVATVKESSGYGVAVWNPTSELYYVVIVYTNDSGLITVQNGSSIQVAENAPDLLKIVWNSSLAGDYVLAGKSPVSFSNVKLLLTPIPEVGTFSQSAGSIGAQVAVSGSNFVGINSVAVNGTPASYTVDSATKLTLTVPVGATSGTISVRNSSGTSTSASRFTVTSSVASHPAFFAGEESLGNGVYYLTFPNGNLFGYYNYQFYPALFHYDLGFEYVIDAQDGVGGLFLYDFMSGHFFYTSPVFPFPYLYDFGLSAFLYYIPATNNPGHYTTNPRYFSNLTTGKIITQ